MGKSEGPYKLMLQYDGQNIEIPLRHKSGLAKVVRQATSELHTALHTAIVAPGSDLYADENADLRNDYRHGLQSALQMIDLALGLIQEGDDVYRKLYMNKGRIASLLETLEERSLNPNKKKKR